MKEFVDQLLSFLQQGISAIFRFVEMVWNWTIDQVYLLFQAPFAAWPLWKQVALVMVAVAVAAVLYRAARELWYAGTSILAAFATLLTVFVKTLPIVVLAGLIAGAGMWAINNFDLPQFVANADRTLDNATR